MRIISHRGNLDGTSSSRTENTINSIQAALQAGFDVEVDIWRKDDVLWLGHDHPQYYLFSSEMLDDKRIWFHAKNLDALQYMSRHHPNSNFFWHQNDDYTLTSMGKIWTYPNKPICSESIIVALDKEQIDSAIEHGAYGICTDDPFYVRDSFFRLDVERRYKTYVEGCMMESIAPVSFNEFNTLLKNGNCEICLIFDNPSCSCAKKS